MTYYGSKELTDSFRTVRNNTITIAQEIPEDKYYGFIAAPGCRTVAQLLVHIAVAPRLQTQIHFVENRSSLVGFDFPGFFGTIIAEEQTPRSKQQIVDLLHSEADKFAAHLTSASEAFLAESIAYPAGMQPPTKPRFEMLLGVKEHEMHHRGQLMLIERMIGITPHLTRQMQERIAAMQAAQSAKAAG